MDRSTEQSTALDQMDRSTEQSTALDQMDRSTEQGTALDQLQSMPASWGVTSPLQEAGGAMTGMPAVRSSERRRI